jgi:hypothetical protein
MASLEKQLSVNPEDARDMVREDSGTDVSRPLSTEPGDARDEHGRDDQDDDPDPREPEHDDPDAQDDVVEELAEQVEQRDESRSYVEQAVLDADETTDVPARTDGGEPDE